jgi:hypothetical protein
MLPIPHLSIRGMYGVGVCYFASLAPIKDIFLLIFWGLIEGVMSKKFKGGDRVLFQFCHVAKVGIIPKTI